MDAAPRGNSGKSKQSGLVSCREIASAKSGARLKYEVRSSREVGWRWLTDEVATVNAGVAARDRWRTRNEKSANTQGMAVRAPQASAASYHEGFTAKVGYPEESLK